MPEKQIRKWTASFLHSIFYGVKKEKEISGLLRADKAGKTGSGKKTETAYFEWIHGFARAEKCALFFLIGLLFSALFLIQGEEKVREEDQRVQKEEEGI